MTTVRMEEYMRFKTEDYTNDKRAINVINESCGGIKEFTNFVDEKMASRNRSEEETVGMFRNCGKKTVPIVIDAIGRYRIDAVKHNDSAELFRNKVFELAEELNIEVDEFWTFLR